jgi:predicted MPP superfamily phosphohydrolase
MLPTENRSGRVHSALRRLFFENLFLFLALLLGLFQVLVWHWWIVVVRDDTAPAAATLLAGGLLLVAINGVVFPTLRRHRRRQGWLGGVLRLYMNLGISTLLVGSVLAFLWLLFLLPTGLLGTIGGSPETAFGVFRLTSVAVVGFVALLLLWGFTGGQAAAARTRVAVTVPGLAPELIGLRIVQISDLHIGNHLEGETLSRWVEQVNATDADVIVVTGDIFDFDPAFVEDGARRLAALKARHGVYAILGNHDVYTGVACVTEALRRFAPGVHLLRDEIVKLPVAAPLYLAGSEDPGRDWTARGVRLPTLEALAAARPDDGPTLLLVHRPELFGQAAELGFPLVLAGHTHGGQMALPTPGGRYNLARVVSPLTRGLYRQGRSTLYVNRGLGVGGPAVRINCSREIATIELR